MAPTTYVVTRGSKDGRLYWSASGWTPDRAAAKTYSGPDASRAADVLSTRSLWPVSIRTA